MRSELAPRTATQWIGLLVGPLLAGAVYLLAPGLREVTGFGTRPALAAAVTIVMATWWLTEAVPIELTACLPLLLYPLFGVLGSGFVGNLQSTALRFADTYVLLFFGGMTIGAAMEECGLHRRVALSIMGLIGSAPQRLLFGMLAATAFVSMWISNTATAVMMLPIAVAITRELEITGGGKRLHQFGCALLLAVAYAANVGGMATKIGTGTNSIFAGFAADRLHADIGFLRYMVVSLPFVLAFLPIIWLLLWRVGRLDVMASGAGGAVLERELRALGSPSRSERRVAAVFVLAAVLWALGDLIRPLLAPLAAEGFGFKLQGKHYEAGVALLAATLLVLGRLLPWAAFRKLPFASLVLLGGSLAMAHGIEQSGLSAWIGQRLAMFGDLPLVAQLALASFGTILLSAFASNTATINVVLNVLPKDMAVLFTAALAASCDFMLPAGTPPNAIVFGSGYVRLSTMIRVGFVLDLLAGVLLTVYMLLYGRHWL